MRTYVYAFLLATVAACGPSAGNSRGGVGAPKPGADLGTAQGPPVVDAAVSLPPQHDASVATVGDASCGGQAFAVTRVQPNVFLVLDRSASMSDPISSSSNTTKWSSLETAITSLVNTFNSQIRFGLSLFAGNEDCEAGKIDVPLGANTGATVLSKVMAATPDSNTPTYATMAAVQKSAGLTDTTRPNVVVLATDGVPDCETTGDEDTDVQNTIAALYAQTPSVKTFIIGIGSGAGSADPTALNAWATAGGTARSGTTKYYQSNSSADLNTAFQAIAGGVASCTFALGSAPPDPTQLFVWENQTKVASDPTNGYTYTASPPSVTLNGTSCSTLQSNATVQVQVVYGCPTPPPIN